MTAPKKASPNGKPTRVIDLDQARAARAESQGDPVTLKFRELDWELPVEMPADFPLLMADGDVHGGVRALIGERFDEFWALIPSMGDLETLADAAAEVYGIDKGEAPASPKR